MGVFVLSLGVERRQNVFSKKQQKQIEQGVILLFEKKGKGNHWIFLQGTCTSPNPMVMSLYYAPIYQEIAWEDFLADNFEIQPLGHSPYQLKWKAWTATLF